MRAFTRALAAVLALAVFAAGVLGVIEVVLAATDRDPWIVPHDEWLADLRVTSWRDDAVVIAGIIALLAGLALLVTQLMARRPASWTVEAPPASSGFDTELSTRGLLSAARDSATSVEGVSQARARLTKKGLLVEARTNRTSSDGLRERVHHAVTGALEPLHLQPPPPVDVRVEASR